MSRVALRAAVMAACACLGLTACGGAAFSPAPAGPTNISGDYSGTVTDSQNGNAAAAATLAQHGANAGGAVTETFASATLTAQMSLTISSSNAVTGTMVIDYPNNGPTCSFSTSGTYNAGTGVLSGSYTAVTNCSGDSGTYSLTQQCTDTVTSGDRRMKTNGVAPC